MTVNEQYNDLAKHILIMTIDMVNDLMAHKSLQAQTPEDYTFIGDLNELKRRVEEARLVLAVRIEQSHISQSNGTDS